MKRTRNGTTTATRASTSTMTSMKALPDWAKLTVPQQPERRGKEDYDAPETTGTTTASTGEEVNLELEEEDDNYSDGDYDYIQKLGYETLIRYIDTTLQKVLQNECYRMMNDIQHFIQHVVVVAESVSHPSLVEQSQQSSFPPPPATAETVPVAPPSPQHIGKKDTLSFSGDGSNSNAMASTTLDAMKHQFTIPHNISSHHYHHHHYYDPLLLPLILINGPFASQDRQLLFTYIFSNLPQQQPQQPIPAQQQSQQQQRPCCVWLSLPSSATTTSTRSKSTLLSSLQEQLVHQCWFHEFTMSSSSSSFRKNHDDTTPTTMNQQQQRQQQRNFQSYMKKIATSSLSSTDQLLLWASQTIYFDSVIIFWSIDHGNIFYNHHHHNTTSLLSLGTFVNWCTERRCRDGVPIAIIMYNPPGGNTNGGYRTPIPLYDISLLHGVRVRHMTATTVPSTKRLFMKFIHAIYMDAITTNNPSAVTILFVILSLCRSNLSTTLYNQDDHCCIVRVVQRIQQLLIPTLLAARSTNFMNTIAIVLNCNPYHNGAINRTTTKNATTISTSSSLLSKRITSLFYARRSILKSKVATTATLSSSYSSSDEVFRNLEEYDVDRYMSSIALQLLYFITKYYIIDNDQSNCDNDKVGSIPIGETDAMNNNNDDCDIPSTSTIFSLFFGCRSNDKSNESHSTKRRDTDNLLREKNINKILDDNDRKSIILHVVKLVRNGTMMTESIFTMLDLFTEEKEHHLSKIQNMIQYSINELIVLLDHCLTLNDVQRCIDSLLLMNDKYGYDPTASYINRVPCPRRDHVRALIQTINKDDDDDDNINNDTNILLLINVPGMMYRLIQNRISVSELEWYQAFIDHIQNNDYELTTTAANATITNWFHIFGYGIRHLQVSGLIRRTEGKNNVVQYERTALVWCGGD